MICEVITLLTEFDTIDGVSGREKPVVKHLSTHLAPITDEYFCDALGNAFFIKHGDPDGPRIMICAHMDEIGLIVNDIYDNGRLSIMPIGIHDPRMLWNQVLTVETKNGPIEGIVGGAPAPHIDKAHASKSGFETLKLDIGATSRAEAEAMGVRQGDIVNNRRGCRILNNRIFSGKAVDNRSGVVAMVLAAKMLANIKTHATIIFTGTAQEEMFLKGARVAANTAKPDVCLSVDVCLGVESDEVSPDYSRVFQGKGPCIQIYDWSMENGVGNIVPAELIEMLRVLAEKNNIPHQNGLMLNGGTDTAEISLTGCGVVSGAVMIPARYIHTAVSTVDVNDVLLTAQLIAAFSGAFKGFAED